MEDKTIIILASLLSLVILEVVALYKGINGTMLTTVFAIIGGIAGYQVKNFKRKP